MSLHKIQEEELRSTCKKKIESLENWLRRLVDDSFTEAYGSDYLFVKKENGDSVIKNSIGNDIKARKEREPFRYPRLIDATLLDNLIDIICNPNNFSAFFKDALGEVFPFGADHARFTIKKIIDPRNQLAHANPISVRQAEQIICYSNDIIDSLKEYYRKKGLNVIYNVPTIMKFVDSFGNEVHRNQMVDTGVGCGIKQFHENEEFFLRPGDYLSIEVQIDPNFEEESYDVEWRISDHLVNNLKGSKFTLEIKNEHVSHLLSFSCRIISKKDWHKYGYYDDEVTVSYRILPPAY
ncbi:hypothetical protein [Bacillus sp. AG4(2022)]|uniref:hypothetical protein n=1 Tax=Bacillus sp. AG4(2022) TaxID=2962594 RepID=UPI002881C64D|nr:hypothetical protein [Bacillus sp. AG4(2022)]MDT0163517.1 hypothetical protein [Bacillus sp. AG4(2022)]